MRAAASASLRESGDAFTISCSSGHALLPDEAENTHDALQIADRRMYAEKGLGVSGGESRGVLLQALAERDESLGTHTNGVARYSAALAAELGLVGSEAKLVRAAAELHDVGKLALPETILQKPGQLDDEEWKIVQQHTLIGERIIAAAEGLEHVALTVRSTHERWDGTGYPDGLSGEEIPLAARMIAICDAYDAITSDRPYRHARSSDRAVEELAGLGRQPVRPRARGGVHRSRAPGSGAEGDRSASADRSEHLALARSCTKEVRRAEGDSCRTVRSRAPPHEYPSFSLPGRIPAPERLQRRPANCALFQRLRATAPPAA